MISPHTTKCTRMVAVIPVYQIGLNPSGGLVRCGIELSKAARRHVPAHVQLNRPANDNELGYCRRDASGPVRSPTCCCSTAGLTTGWSSCTRGVGAPAPVHHLSSPRRYLLGHGRRPAQVTSRRQQAWLWSPLLQVVVEAPRHQIYQRGVHGAAGFSRWAPERGLVACLPPN